jgi:hypothetical protein
VPASFRFVPEGQGKQQIARPGLLVGLQFFQTPASHGQTDAPGKTTQHCQTPLTHWHAHSSYGDMALLDCGWPQQARCTPAIQSVPSGLQDPQGRTPASSLHMFAGLACTAVTISAGALIHSCGHAAAAEAPPAATPPEPPVAEPPSPVTPASWSAVAQPNTNSQHAETPPK